MTSLAAPKQPRLQTGPDAEITYDGLHRVDKSVMDAAWVKPDLDLRPYTKLLIANAGVAYRKLDPVSDFRASSETQFPVQEENKARFEKILKEEFSGELEKLERYEIVTKPGPDVLLLVGGVIDVLSRVPPNVEVNQSTRASSVAARSWPRNGAGSRRTFRPAPRDRLQSRSRIRSSRCWPGAISSFRCGCGSTPHPSRAGDTYTTTTSFDMFRLADGRLVEHWDAAVKPSPAR